LCKFDFRNLPIIKVIAKQRLTAIVLAGFGSGTPFLEIAAAAAAAKFA